MEEEIKCNANHFVCTGQIFSVIVYGNKEDKALGTHYNLCQNAIDFFLKHEFNVEKIK